MEEPSMSTLLPRSQPLVLVLGLSGAIGGAIAAALAGRGYRIRALTRRDAAQRAALDFPVERVEGDALDATARGASLIVHGVNPPGYARWREDGLPMLANTIAAARESGATILFPANVYVFSDESSALADENEPKKPKTRKGQVRFEMEKMLEEAAHDMGVRSICVRAGDFFGPGVTNSWFTQVVAKGGRTAQVLRRMTPDGIGHAWAYIPDLADCFARLVERRDRLSPFEMVHFAGHYDATGIELVQTARRVIGRPDLPIKPFRWIMLYLGAPFVPFLREAIEMLWLWKHPLQLNNAKLRSLIGEEPHTPLAMALAATFDHPHP
jgi:nucleoside-diphosphate-sugar epimerase